MSTRTQSVNYPGPSLGANTPSQQSTARLWPWVLLLAVGAGATFFLAHAPRVAKQAAVIQEGKELSLITVAVLNPKPGKAAEALALPAELRPLSEADIFARANGYVKQLAVDIGQRVEEGQLLIELDAPELTRQLEGAKADLAHAQAALDLSQTTAERWKELLKTKTVSAQDNAEKQSDVRVQSANVESMRANVHRIEETLVFTKIVAPFRGIITMRQVDVGDLVSPDKPRALFHISQVRTLRAFVNVPQAMSRGIHVGQVAELTMPELPGRTFEAKVVRTAGAMDAGSRTLLTELQVDNAKDELLAGSFSQIRFPDLKPEAELTLPANCLLIRAEGPQAAVVGADNKVQLRALTLGRDFGSTVEVLAGVKAEDRVILNPPDSIADGADVRISDTAKTDGKNS
jgi:RND family efflux transporter MFP subunit